MPTIEIGSSKQLFFDDYLIESLTRATRGLNPAIKADDNPVLRPERLWEGNRMRPLKTIFDPHDQVFKMWYSTATTNVLVKDGEPVPGGFDGYLWDSKGSAICLATSPDGVNWDRPSLGLVEFDGSTDNNILPEKENLPTVPAFQDLHEKDPAKLYKAVRLTGGTQTRGLQYDLFYSPDALDWTPYEGNPVIDTGQELGRWAGIFHKWDPIRETYFVTMEASHHWRGPYGKRLVGRADSPDMIHWSEPEILLVTDDDDHADTEFYSMPTFPYEGNYVALLWIFRTTNVTHHPEVVFSRNGFHYQRNFREPYIPRGGALADFDSSSVYAMDTIVHGDRIMTYYIGSNTRSPEIGFALGDKAREGIGLAVSRLDGFVSLDSGKGWIVADRSEDELQKISGERVLFDEPESFGQMVTRPFGFSGSSLHLNAGMAPLAAGPGPGEVRVEIVRANHKKLAGFTFNDADPMKQSGTGHVVSWKGNSDLSTIAGQSIKLRFYFKNAKLYSFQFK